MEIVPTGWVAGAGGAVVSAMVAMWSWVKSTYAETNRKLSECEARDVERIEQMMEVKERIGRLEGRHDLADEIKQHIVEHRTP